MIDNIQNQSKKKDGSQNFTSNIYGDASGQTIDKENIQENKPAKKKKVSQACRPQLKKRSVLQ